MKKRKILATLLSLLMILSVAPLTTLAAGNTVLYDMKTALTNGSVACQAFHSSGVTNVNVPDADDIDKVAPTASYDNTNDVLTFTNPGHTFGMVPLYTYNSAMGAEPYSVSITLSFTPNDGESWNAAKDYVRGGIAFNVKDGVLGGEWIAINSKNICQKQKYWYDNDTAAYEGVTDNQHMSGEVFSGSTYKIILRFMGNGVYTYTVYDANGVIYFQNADETAFENAKNFCVYGRNSVVTVTDFIVQKGTIEESAFEEASTFYATEVYNMKRDLKASDLVKDETYYAYQSDGVPQDITASYENETLTVASQGAAFGTVELYDFTDNPELLGQTFVVSTTLSFTKLDGSAWGDDTTENVWRAGVCFDVAPGTNGSWASINSNSVMRLQHYENQSKIYEYDSEEIAAKIMANKTYTIKLFFAKNRSFVVRVYDTAGKEIVSMASSITAAAGEKYPYPSFDIAKNFGILSRFSKVTVTDYTVTTYSEENATRYIGVQSPISSTVGDTYAVRFIAGLQNTNATEAGFRVTIANGGKTMTRDYPVSTIYTTISAMDSNGMVIGYTARSLNSNYLMAYGFTGIPTSGGDVTFTITPYYIQSGRRKDGQGCTVVYNAGVLVSQSVVA